MTLINCLSYRGGEMLSYSLDDYLLSKSFDVLDMEDAESRILEALHDEEGVCFFDANPF